MLVNIVCISDSQSGRIFPPGEHLANFFWRHFWYTTTRDGKMERSVTDNQWKQAKNAAKNLLCPRKPHVTMECQNSNVTSANIGKPWSINTECSLPFSYI